MLSSSDMKGKLTLVIILLITMFAGAVIAHPLGNFSINQYSRLEVGARQIKLREVLDMAEIPTFQESAAIDTDRDGKLSPDELSAYASKLTPAYAANLRILLNGEDLAVGAISAKPELGTGAGDLPILRIIWDFIAELPSQKGNRPIGFSKQ